MRKRGEFVEELEVGYELEREVEGKKRVVKLGYRRNDAVIEDMDLDEGEGDGKVAGKNDAAVDNVLDNVPLQNL